MPCIAIQLLQSKQTKCTLVIISFTKVLLHEGPSSGNQLQNKGIGV